MKTRAPLGPMPQQRPATATPKAPVPPTAAPVPLPATFDLSKIPIHRPDSGEPLPADIRTRFEPRFGTDLGRVRVHRDPEAERWVSQLGANAATVGNHVAFAPGKYTPSTPSGERVLAHELAHVVQNARHEATPGTMSAPGDAAESEATGAAERVVAGLPSGPLRAPVAAIARDTPKKADVIEFEVDPTNPNMLVHEPPPESQAEWIDNSLQECGFTIWLFGFDVWVKGHPDPIRIPDDHINFAVQNAVPINHHIYNSYAEASAAVAKEPHRLFDVTPRYAYYWGAGGQVIVPTLICPATAPRTTETMWETRLKYVDYVERALMGVAEMLILSRVFGWLWGRYGQIEPEAPPARPVPPARPKPAAPTTAPEPAPEPVKAPEPTKTSEPSGPARTKAPVTGETESTRVGKDVHKANADARRKSGDWDDVNKPIKTVNGEEIRVPKRVNLKTGEPVGDETQNAQPDAVSYRRGEILDDKPVGRPIMKDRQELIRNIEAYRQRTGHLPERIVIDRYDPVTGKHVATEIYPPDKFLP